MDSVALSLSQVSLCLHDDSVLHECLIFFVGGTHQIYEFTLGLLHHDFAAWLRESAESIINQTCVNCSHGQACVLAIKQDRDEAGLAKDSTIESVKTRLNHFEGLAALL